MIIKLQPNHVNFLTFILIGYIGFIVLVPAAQSDQEWQTLVDKAGAAYEKGDSAKALELLKAAVQLTDSGTEARAAVLNNLAIVIEASGDLDGAESLYTKVIGLWAELKGSDHPNVTRTLGNLADLNHRRGQLDDAVEAYKLAVATIDQNNTVEAKEVKRAIYVSYAKLLRELGRNTEADRVLQKVFHKPKQFTDPLCLLNAEFFIDIR